MRPLNGRRITLALGFVLATAAATSAQAPLREGYPAALTGLIYKDAATNVILYVETDGRHIVAISPEGKILWRKDPFVDAGLQPYRIARPTIDSIGPGGELPAGSGRHVFGIRFTSSQMGFMDIGTGEFTFEGQN